MNSFIFILSLVFFTGGFIVAFTGLLILGSMAAHKADSSNRSDLLWWLPFPIVDAVFSVFLAGFLSRFVWKHRRQCRPALLTMGIGVALMLTGVIMLFVRE